MESVLIQPIWIFILGGIWLLMAYMYGKVSYKLGRAEHREEVWKMIHVAEHSKEN